MARTGSYHVNDKAIIFPRVNSRSPAYHLCKERAAFRWSGDDHTVYAGLIETFCEHAAIGDQLRLACVEATGDRAPLFDGSAPADPRGRHTFMLEPPRHFVSKLNGRSEQQRLTAARMFQISPDNLLWRVR